MIADAISDAVDVDNISSLIIIRADSGGVEERNKEGGKKGDKRFSRRNCYYSRDEVVLVEEVCQALYSNVAKTPGRYL